MACMWLLYRPNFAEVARTTYKADQTWDTWIRLYELERRFIYKLLSLKKQIYLIKCTVFITQMYWFYFKLTFWKFWWQDTHSGPGVNLQVCKTYNKIPCKFHYYSVNFQELLEIKSCMFIAQITTLGYLFFLNLLAKHSDIKVMTRRVSVKWALWGIL
jgi:hypothetical protein